MVATKFSSKKKMKRGDNYGIKKDEQKCSFCKGNQDTTEHILECKVTGVSITFKLQGRRSLEEYKLLAAILRTIKKFKEI